MTDNETHQPDEAGEQQGRGRNTPSIPQVFYCHTSGREVVPVKVEQRDGAIWFYCNAPCHVWDGHPQVDCHVATFDGLKK